MKGRVMEEDIHGSIRGLDGKNSDCKLAMHANSFDERRKITLYRLDNKHDSERSGRCVTQLDSLKSCCCYSLRDLCVHTDGA